MTSPTDMHTVRVTLAPGAEAHIVWIGRTPEGWAFGANALGQAALIEWHPSRHETRLAAHAAAVAALRATVPPVKVLVRDTLGDCIGGRARFSDGAEYDFFVNPSGATMFGTQRPGARVRSFRSPRRAIDLRAALALPIDHTHA